MGIMVYSFLSCMTLRTGNSGVCSFLWVLHDVYIINRSSPSGTAACRCLGFAGVSAFAASILHPPEIFIHVRALGFRV